MSVPSILKRIVDVKHQEISLSQKSMPKALLEHIIAENNDEPRGFFDHLKQRVDSGKNAVIAEIKKASPSKGVICENFEPEIIAKDYQKNGAACLSVLTDESFFQGHEVYLEAARLATAIPVIRKDFIVDEYQIYQSRAMGADCILLIAACLDAQQMFDYTQLAYELGMDVLVEVHNLAELEKTQSIPLRMLGINNRNLHNFEVNLNTTYDLMQYVSGDVLLITESGISSKQEVSEMNEKGIYSFLIGERFMRQNSPGTALSQLFMKT